MRIPVDHDRVVRQSNVDGLTRGQRMGQFRHLLGERSEIERSAVERQVSDLHPGGVQQLVDMSLQTSRLLQCEGSLLPHPILDTGLSKATDEELQATGERRQGGAQLVGRHRQELLLLVPKAAVGDVADDQHAPRCAVSSWHRLGVGLEPAPCSILARQCEDLGERFPLRGTMLWPILWWKRLARLVLWGERGRHAEEPVVGGIGQDDLPLPVKNEDGISQTGQNRLQPGVFDLARPALLLERENE